MGLEEAVTEATEWVDEDGSGHAKALAQLARSLAKELADPSVTEGKAPPTAALAKELRATLEDLEALRDGDTAGADLGAQMSTPVFHTPQSGSADVGAERGEGGKVAAPALHAVAGVGGGRRARGRA